MFTNRQIALSILILAYISAVPVLAEPHKNRIFAHWGNYDANREMLELGGYDFQGRPHDTDLSNGQQARVNEAVIAKTFEWYIAGNKTDAAGPGLYESSSFHDSANFGSDLLILEVHAPPPGFLLPYNETLTTYDHKKFFDGNNMAEAPPIVKYSGTWYVIPRAPRGSEPTWTFRPPNANDVGRVWEQINESAQEQADIAKAAADARKIPNINEPFHKEKLIAAEIASLAPIAKRIRSASKMSTSRSSEIFLDRLFYDLGYDYLVKTILPLTRSLLNDDKKMATYLNLLSSLYKISSEYTKRLPNDSRTQELRSFAVQQTLTLSTQGLTILVNNYENIQSLTDFCEGIDPVSLKSIAHRILSLEASTFTGDTYGNLLKMKSIKGMPIEDVATIENFILTHLPKSNPEKIGNLANLTGILNLLEKSEEGKSWIIGYLKEKVYGKSAVAMTRYMPGNTGSTAISVMESIGQSEKATEWARLVGLELLNGCLNSKTELGSERGHAFTSLLFGLGPILKKDFPEYIKPIRARLQGPEGKSLLRKLNDVQLFRVTNFSKPQEFERIAFLSEHVPELIPTLIHSIETSIIDFLKPIDHMKRIAVLADLKKKAGALLTPLSAAESLRAQFRGLFKKELQELAKKNNVSLYEFLRTQLPASVLPVPDSLAYSELAKVFSLVDPIFVTEDIMINNARSPHLRFNEAYVKDGETLKQPAWENFSHAWNQLSLQNFRSNSRLITPEIQPIELSRINSLLISGYVDQGNKAEGINWTRSKYKTAFTREEWKRYDAQSIIKELKRFFTISTEDGKTVLQFKSLDELKTTMPGLKDVQPPKEDRNVVLGLQILTGQKTTDPAQDILFNYIELQTRDIQDPISKATRILYLMTKLHPAENGNGRLGRLWASVVLMQAGLPVPVALPTNDFLMSEEHLRLEVRRSVANGKFYMAMLNKAKTDGIAVEDFFPKVFKGSALEGLIHVDVKSTVDLKSYVNYLETLSEAPDWGKAFLVKVQGRIQEMRLQNGALGKTSEVRRDMAMEDAFIAFRKETQLDFSVPERTTLPMMTKSTSAKMCAGFYK